MRVIPYVFVENCHEALEYYTNVFGGKVTFTHKADDSEKLLHARIDFNEHYALYLSDIFDKVEFGDNCTISFEFDTEDEIKMAYDKLKEGSTINMELQETFWGATFALLKDKYNVVWQLNYDHKK